MNSKSNFLFKIPIMFMIVFFVIPLALTVVWSVFERTMFWMEPGFTLFSYENFFFSARLENFVVSMLHSSVSVFCSFLIGFPIAIFIRRRVKKVAQHRAMLLFILPFMVSEIIRWQSPVGHMCRTAMEDVQIQGKTIKKWEKVAIWYTSGNRDDNKFEDPDVFDIEREDARQHLSFGFGIHRCLGNRLADLQLKILWEEILERFTHIEITLNVTHF